MPPSDHRHQPTAATFAPLQNHVPDAVQRKHPTECSATSHSKDPTAPLLLPVSSSTMSSRVLPGKGKDLYFRAEACKRTGQHIDMLLCPQAHRDLQPKGPSVSTRYNCKLRTWHTSSETCCRGISQRKAEPWPWGGH